MFRSIAFVMLWLLGQSGAWGENGLIDPMRPPSAAEQTRSTPSGPRWRLNAILVSPERRLAMINDRLIGIGGVIDGARVKSIHGNAVELDVNGQSVVLHPGTYHVRRGQQ